MEIKMKNKIIKLLGLILFCIELTGCKTNSLKDVDGNVYKTVTIGTQVWMAENLKTTKYNDGTAIPLVTDDKAWAALNTSAYCWYKNDATANKNRYGALYNFFTVNENKLCPRSWHVSYDADWITLTAYLKGDSVAGGKLKEMGVTHWQSPNTGATNESGFTALPGGYRLSYGGSFGYIGSNGYWWSPVKDSSSVASYRYIGNGSTNVFSTSYSKRSGYAVRCVKDN
jgi:uncharacterized protein (TIGR02145 family)